MGGRNILPSIFERLLKYSALQLINNSNLFYKTMIVKKTVRGDGMATHTGPENLKSQVCRFIISTFELIWFSLFITINENLGASIAQHPIEGAPESWQQYIMINSNSFNYIYIVLGTKFLANYLPWVCFALRATNMNPHYSFTLFKLFMNIPSKHIKYSRILG